ncbi:MAG: lipid deacylase LpxR family protein [Flavipsychrobacter sp.]|jgi:hypothetical protein|nr:lipid deacylase LpxR family protein [Flavipsychrobacter sp.]
MKRWNFIVLMLCLTLSAAGQAIDNTLSYRNINSDKYLRLNYDNDVFDHTDGYYSQGAHIEVVSPGLKHFPLTKILAHPAYSHMRYGIGIEHDMYTPSSIKPELIRQNDRPYAGCLHLKTFLVATDTVKKQRFSSTVSTGVIGKAAFGEDIQVWGHKFLGQALPSGWSEQIHNDVIFNYQVNYERQLFHYRNILLLSADGMARAGTLSDKLAIGSTIMLGKFDSPYGSLRTTKKFRFYIYDRPEVSAVFYDATLQGGLFDLNSPYTIKSNNLNRYTFQNRVGAVVNYGRLYVEYFRTILTPEFKTGTSHAWGGIQLTMSL